MLQVEKQWHTWPQKPLVPEKVYTGRDLSNLIPVEKEEPFYKLLQEQIQIRAGFLNTDELAWLQHLRGQFDSYMTIVLKQTHYQLWDTEQALRREYRSMYTNPPDIEQSKTMDIFTIMARLLYYNELIREIIHLREGPETRSSLNLDLFIQPPPKVKAIWGTDRFGDPFYHWHGAGGSSLVEYNENEEGRVGLDPVRRWGYYLDVFGKTPYETYNNGLPARDYRMACCNESVDFSKGCWMSFDPNQEAGKPVKYQLLIQKDYWGLLAENKTSPSQLDFSKDYQIGTAWKNANTYRQLHNQIQNLWQDDTQTGEPGCATLLKGLYAEYITLLDKAVQEKKYLPLNPTEVLLSSKDKAKVLNKFKDLVHLLYEYNEIHGDQGIIVDYMHEIDEKLFKVNTIGPVWISKLRSGIMGKDGNRIAFPNSDVLVWNSNEIDILKQLLSRNLPYGNVTQSVRDVWVKRLDALFDTAQKVESVQKIWDQVQTLLPEFPIQQPLINYDAQMNQLRQKGITSVDTLRNEMMRTLQESLKKKDLDTNVKLPDLPIAPDATYLDNLEEQVQVDQLKKQLSNVNNMPTAVDIPKTKITEIRQFLQDLKKMQEDIEKFEERREESIVDATKDTSDEKIQLYNLQDVIDTYIVDMQSLSLSSVLFEINRTIIQITNIVTSDKTENVQKAVFKDLIPNPKQFKLNQQQKIDAKTNEAKSLFNAYNAKKNAIIQNKDAELKDGKKKALQAYESLVTSNPNVWKEVLVFDQILPRLNLYSELMNTLNFVELTPKELKTSIDSYLKMLQDLITKFQQFTTKITLDSEEDKKKVLDIWNRSFFLSSKQIDDLLQDMFKTYESSKAANLKKYLNTVNILIDTKISLFVNEKEKAERKKNEDEDERKRKEADAKAKEAERKRKEEEEEERKQKEKDAQEAERKRQEADAKAKADAERKRKEAEDAQEALDRQRARVQGLPLNLNTVQSNEISNDNLRDTAIRISGDSVRQTGLLHAAWAFKANDDGVLSPAQATIAQVRGLSIAQVNLDEDEILEIDEDEEEEEQIRQEQERRKQAEAQKAQEEERERIRQEEEQERLRLEQEQERIRLEDERRKQAEAQKAAEKEDSDDDDLFSAEEEKGEAVNTALNLLGVNDAVAPSQRKAVASDPIRLQGLQSAAQPGASIIDQVRGLATAQVIDNDDEDDDIFSAEE
jgi:hypothetical protein